MKTQYIILAAILILAGLGLVFLPEKTHSNETMPEELLVEINDPSRFLTTDQVAEMIISGDPALFLIDVRDFYSYEEYRLPGALNIPFEEILLEDWADYLDQQDMMIVFYSNGDIYADQAWTLNRRLNRQNIYVLKGGLNCWAETILQPKPPAETAPSEDFDLYEFRKGASIYFGGGNSVETSTESTEIITVKRKKKENKVEGGC